MAKRMNVGSVCKNKDGSGTYIKMSMDVTLKRGDYLNLESKATQLKNIDIALEKNMISPENAEKAKERVSAIPEFVMFSVIQNQKT